jgi:hypothetical protein
MDKDPTLAALWEELGKLGFRHREKYGAVFKELYLAEKQITSETEREQVLLIRNWLLVPYSFWPIYFPGLGKHVLGEIRSGRRISAQVETILSFLRKFPTRAAQQIVAEHELEVQEGAYGRFLLSTAKFAALEAAKLKCPRFQADYARLKKDFNVDKFRDPRRGLLRRTMVMERNFKAESWFFQIVSDEEEAFQLALDSLCCAHDLYGIEGDRPLLQKLSVNVTPFNVLISVPLYLLPDFRRDINWNAIANLLATLGAEPIGEKRAAQEQEKIDEALRTLRAAETATALKLTGDARLAHIRKEAGLPKTADARKIRKLVADARVHLEGAADE